MGTGDRMIGCGLSLGRADRLGQPRLSEVAQPYLVAELWHDFHNPGPDPEPYYPHLAPEARDL
jgi:hypothetical protein